MSVTEERTSADVNAAEHDEDPLHHAVDIAAADTVETLLDAGADVDLRDRWGNTPLWRAVYLGTGGEKIVDLLLAHGATRRSKTITKSARSISPGEWASTTSSPRLRPRVE